MAAFETGGRLALLNLAIGLGTFIQILDTSIANVAIPYIAGNLSVSSDEGTWVITSFAASNAIVLPLTGWLSNYFGRVRLFVWSVLLFVLTSFLCGFSTSLPMLIFFRVMQGAVAGSLIPLSQSLIMICNPPEKQGGALGMWSMVIVVAPVLGPIIGGYLTEEYSWPWIFYINIPLGLFSAFIVWYFLKNQESKIIRDPIDWTGLALLSIGVGCFQIMLDKGLDLDWFESKYIIILFIVSLISISYFIIWNCFQKHPIVNFSFLKDRNFALGTFIITLGFLIYFSSTVTVPLWLQTEQNYTAFWAGVAVAPIGIPSFIISRWLGKNMHKYDQRLLASLSFFLFAVGLFYQMNFTTEVSLEKIMFARFLQGFGLAFFLLPVLHLSLANIPEKDYASATGLFHFIRILVGSGFGTSLSVYLWTRLAIFHHERLAESITAYRPLTATFYSMMKNYNTNFTTNVINRITSMQVEQQAYMLSTNDIVWLSAVAFLAMIPFVFFCKRVRPKTS